MKYIYLFLSMAIFLMSGCKEDEKTGNVEVVLRSLYNNEPLVLLESYPYGNKGQNINFSQLDFFLDNLEIVNAKGEAVTLREIALINMGFSTENESVNGTRYIFQDIPTGNYQTLRFGVGVDPSLNDTKPADYSSSSPLSAVSHYWPGWNSYIFSKTEGNLDVDGDETFDMGFALHTGSNKEIPTDLFRELSAQVSFDVMADATREIILYLDYGKLLEAESEGLDIENNPHTNDPNDMTFTTAMVENYQNAFSISIP